MTEIDISDFERRATAAGYSVFPKELEANVFLDEHVHDFDAWGLVTAGEFHITVGGKKTVYRSGEEFQLPADSPHSECAGPDGVSFLAGRRSKIQAG